MSRNPAFSLVSDMEPDVCNLARWASLLMMLGAEDAEIEAKHVHVIGVATMDLSKRLTRKWEEAFEAAGGQV